MQKKDLEQMEPGAKAYFESLPVMLQEQLTQSGVKITTKEQLESCCKNILEQKDRQ